MVALSDPAWQKGTWKWDQDGAWEFASDHSIQSRHGPSAQPPAKGGGTAT